MTNLIANIIVGLVLLIAVGCLVLSLALSPAWWASP